MHMKSLVEHARFLLLAALSVLTAMGADSNPPNLMTYQGRVYDSSGTPVDHTTPGSHTIKFRIYDVETGGVPLWAESQSVTVSDGYFSVLLGQGSQISGELHNFLSDLFKGVASDRYIGITLDSGSEIAPRLRFLPSPYAFLAQRATSLVDSAGAEVITIGTGNQLTVGQLNATTINGSANIASKVYGELHGDGSSITSLNAGQLSSGTVPLGRMDSKVVRTDTLQTISGDKTFSGDVKIVGGLLKVEASPITIGTAAKNTITISPNGNIATDGEITTEGDISAAKITASGTVTANSFEGNGTIPVRGIIMWYGTETDLPAGWHLCDGGTYDEVVTPDLRNRFIMGGSWTGTLSYYQASKSGANRTGGSTNVTLRVENVPPHQHMTEDASFITDVDSGDVDALPSGWSYKNIGSGDSLGLTTDDRTNNHLVYRNQKTKADIYNVNGTEITSAGAESQEAFTIQPPYYVLAFIIRTK